MNSPETSKEQHRRSQYKAVSTALSDTHDRAKMSVTGTAEEAQLMASGAAELETYLKRAGFTEIQVRAEGLFVRAWGHKPKGSGA